MNMFFLRFMSLRRLGFSHAISLHVSQLSEAAFSWLWYATRTIKGIGGVYLW
jgi:hypothetical protein